MPQIARHTKEYATVDARLAAVLRGTPWGEGNVTLSFTAARMTAAAYQTAEVTGAFRYMNYEEVREYSGLYDIQARYTQLADEIAAASALLLGPVMLTRPDDLSRSDLEAVKRDLEQAFARLNQQVQLGRILNGAYARALKRVESTQSDE